MGVAQDVGIAPAISSVLKVNTRTTDCCTNNGNGNEDSSCRLLFVLGLLRL